MSVTRKEMSDSVSHLGWRYVLGVVRACIHVTSLGEGATLAALIASRGGDVDIDLRHDRVLLSTKDTDLAARITSVAREAGFETSPAPVQALEIAIDALDIPSVLPFWQAILAYQKIDEISVSDPSGQGPAVWFQQMDHPRPQRNRIHLDVSVPHDAAPERIAAALDAGGIMVSDKAAPAFWVLSDVEGNEACITTWQGRD